MRSISAIVRKPSEVSLSHFVCAKDESRQVPQGFTIHMHKHMIVNDFLAGSTSMAYPHRYAVRVQRPWGDG